MAPEWFSIAFGIVNCALRMVAGVSEYRKMNGNVAVDGQWTVNLNTGTIHGEQCRPTTSARRKGNLKSLVIWMYIWISANLI